VTLGPAQGMHGDANLDRAQFSEVSVTAAVSSREEARLDHPCRRLRRLPHAHAVHAAESADVILACEQRKGNDCGATQRHPCDPLHCLPLFSWRALALSRAIPGHVLPKSRARLSLFYGHFFCCDRLGSKVGPTRALSLAWPPTTGHFRRSHLCGSVIAATH